MWVAIQKANQAEIKSMKMLYEVDRGQTNIDGKCLGINFASTSMLHFWKLKRALNL